MAEQNLGKVAITTAGAYDSSVEYGQLTIVTYGGESWLSRATVPVGNPPSEDSDYWQLILSPKIERKEMTSTSASINPNTFYVWGEVASLDITLNEGASAEENRYMFQFRNPKSGATVLTLPDDILWSVDTELGDDGLPLFGKGEYTRIEIIEGLASVKKWALPYIIFADAEVERVLMANGLGDGTGITKQEAKGVTSIGTWFRENTVIETFDEFEIFENVTFLGSSNQSYRWAFAGCTNLKSITLPPNLIKLYNGAISYGGVGAFYGCTSLTRVENFKVLQEIGSYAFYNCTSLTFDELNLQNLTTLGKNAFYGVKIKKLNSGALTTLPAADNSTQNYGDKSVLEEVILSDALSVIPEYSFRDYIELSSIKLPSNLTKIGTQAFFGCTLLELDVATLPKTINTMGNLAFQGVKTSGVLDLPNLTGTIVWGNYNNTDTKLLDGVENLGTVTSVAGFMRQTKLKFAKIPSTCTKLDTDAFSNCTSLEYLLVLNPNPPTLGTAALSNTNNCPIYVPDASVETYKAATNWNDASIATRIKGISELPTE